MDIVLLLSVFHGHHREGWLIISLIEKKSGIQLVHLPVFLLDINELANRNEKDCFSTSYCIAHSMGNYLLRKGLEYLSGHLGSPRGRMLFDETILLAADISAKDIEVEGKGSYIADFSRRVHVYYSKYDRALKASSVKRFGDNRLGSTGQTTMTISRKMLFW
jgi:esterase/lipase superfamily enzyme